MRKLKSAFRVSITGKRSFVITALVALVTFSLMILGSFPGYSFQLLAHNPFTFLIALQALTLNLYNSAGLVAVVLTVIYAVVAGVAMSNLAARFNMTDSSGVKEAGMLSPGLVVSGCASCGAGVLGLVGLGGALASLPFRGNLVRLGGIGLILFFLQRSGDPEVCRIDSQE